jgi:putative ABC transport system permease protein
MILLRKALRDVKAMGTRALLLVLVIGAGVGMAAGIGLALRDVRATRDAFYQNQALADLDVRLQQPIPTAVLAARARAAGATLAETRLVLDGTASHGAQRTAAEVLGMRPDARLDRLAIVQGRSLSEADPLGAAIEAQYARTSGLRVGDTLELAISGRSLPVRVRGLARSPEYLLATSDPQYLIPQPGSLAVVFLPRGGLAGAVGAADQANDLVLDLPPGTPRGRELAVAAGLPVARLIPRSEQFSLRFTNADLHSFELFAPILGAVFATVGFLLIGLSLRRLVQSQRRELGTLLAIGYRRPTVLATVVLPAAVLAVPGAAVAVSVTIGIGRLVSGTYVSAIGFPRILSTLAAGPLAQAAGVAIGATIAAAALPAWTLLRLTPAAAMRGEAVVRFQPPGWLARATAASSPQVAYAGRSLARRPLLTAATVLSLSAAVGLGAALNLLVASTSRAVDETVAGQGWTAAADLAQPLPTRAAVALAREVGATAVEPVVKGPARLTAHGGTADVELVGQPASPTLLRPAIIAGGAPAAGQILVSEQTAQALGVAAGQRVHITTPNGTRDMTVSGTARTLASGQSYLPADQAAALLDLSGRSNALFLAATDTAIHGLRERPEVARVISLAAARSGMHDLVRELTGLIDVLLAISLAVGALFLVSSLALSSLDRQGEFATLRALGYGRNRIATILGTEALVESTVAGALSIPAGLLLAWPLAARIGQAWFRIGLHPTPSNFALVAALAIALALLAAAHAVRRVLRLDIASAVRARFIG